MPYLVVTEPSNKIDILCDGFVCSYDNNPGQYDVAIFQFLKEDASTQLAYMRGVGGGTYELNFDDNRVITLVSQTVTRVHIRVAGTFVQQGGGAEHPGTKSVIYDFYHYSDRLFIEVTWTTDDQVVDGDLNGRQVYIDETNNLTNEAFIRYDAGGSEVTTSGDGTTYVGVTSDEMTAFIGEIDSTQGTGTASVTNFTGFNPGELTVGWDDGTLGDSTPADETHTLSVFVIVDTVEKAGGEDFDSAALREPIGDQYTDTTLTLTTGTQVEDLNIPDTIGTEMFASDGAWHVEQSATLDSAFTADIARNNMNLVVHQNENWGIKTAASASSVDEHLIGYWKCDDNAASSTVVATVGTNASLQSGNTSTYTSTISTRGTGIDTQNTTWINLPLADHDAAFLSKGTIIMTFFPQFATTVGSNVNVFGFRDSTGTDRIYLEYQSGNDDYCLVVDWGAVFDNNSGRVSFNNSFQDQPVTVHCCWDSDNDFFLMRMFDQTVVGSNAGVPTNAPATAQVGAYNSGAGDIIIDEVRTYNTVILPYGASYSGVGSVGTADRLSVNHAVAGHSDVTCYVDCKSGSGVLVGTGSTTESGVTFVTGVDGVANGAAYINAGSDQYSFSADETDGTMDGDLGKISLWYKSIGDVSSGHIFSWKADSSPSSSDFRIFRNGLNDNLTWQINASSISLTGMTTDIWDGNWHYLEFKWDVSTTTREIWVNGVLEDSSTTSWTAIALTAGDIHLGRRYDGFFGDNAYFQYFYITNNPNTPQLWTAGYKPILLPVIDVA